VGKPEVLSGSQTEDLSLLKNKTSVEPGSDSALSGPTHKGPTLNRPDMVAKADNHITPAIQDKMLWQSAQSSSVQ